MEPNWWNEDFPYPVSPELKKAAEDYHEKTAGNMLDFVAGAKWEYDTFISGEIDKKIGNLLAALDRIGKKLGLKEF